MPKGVHLGAVPQPAELYAANREPALFESSDPLGELLHKLSGLAARRRRNGLAVSLVAGADMLAIVAGFATGALVRIGQSASTDLLVGISACIPLYFLFALQNRAYNLWAIIRTDQSLERSLGSFLLALGAMTLVLFAAKASSDLSRLQVGFSALACLIFLTAARYGMVHAIRRWIGEPAPVEVALLDEGGTPPARDALVVQARQLDLRPDPLDAGMIDKLAQIAHGADMITVHCAESSRAAWAFMLKGFTIRSEIRTPEMDRLLPLGLICRDGEVHMVVSQSKLVWHQAAMKRLFDIVLAAAMLIVLAPVMLAISILIKAGSPGPVLFRQARVGYSNRTFMLYKFRSMRTRPAHEDKLELTSRDDDRVTSIGKFIRATSLDELPQLFNVLLGSMSLVGPRPHALLATAGDQLYWNVDPSYWHRHAVKPGITGLAQIQGFRGNTFAAADLEKRLNADLVYVNSWSVWRDLYILLATFRVVLARTNAF